MTSRPSLAYAAAVLFLAAVLLVTKDCAEPRAYPPPRGMVGR